MLWWRKPKSAVLSGYRKKYWAQRATPDVARAGFETTLYY